MVRSGGAVILPIFTRQFHRLVVRAVFVMHEIMAGADMIMVPVGMMVMRDLHREQGPDSVYSKHRDHRDDAKKFVDGRISPHS